MGDFFKCECPHCGINIEFADSDAGRIADCPSCGNAVELPAPKARLVETKPPSLQPQVAPPQTIYIKEKPKTGCLTQIIALFLIGGLIMFIIGLLDSDSSSPLTSSPTSAPEKPRKTVNAGISYDDYKVQIRNMDAFDWPELNVYINPGSWGPLSGYGIRIHELKAGDSVTIPLDQFTKSGGERFNPFAYRVTELWIGGDDFNYQGYTHM